jgi:hypothetical protein
MLTKPSAIMLSLEHWLPMAWEKIRLGLLVIIWMHIQTFHRSASVAKGSGPAKSRWSAPMESGLSKIGRYACAPSVQTQQGVIVTMLYVLSVPATKVLKLQSSERLGHPENCSSLHKLYPCALQLVS